MKLTLKQFCTFAEEENPKNCTSGVFYCHSKAMCDDYATGYCCVCQPGFYGNGLSCLNEGSQVLFYENWKKII